MAQLFRIVTLTILMTSVTYGMLEPAVARAGKQINRKSLLELKGTFEFGMTRKQVIQRVTKQVKERFDDKIFATSDVYQQDKLRRERDQEIERFKDSYVEFDGKVTGWDVSVIDDQFVHKTGESMMMYWEPDQGRNQRRFFFFHDGRLYKMVLTLDASAIARARRNFAVFRRSMERRYGMARENEQGLSWPMKDYLVIALNRLLHYDSLCLVLVDPKRSRGVIAMRAEREQKVEQKSPLIRAMIGDETPDLDSSADVIDHILRD